MQILPKQYIFSRISQCSGAQLLPTSTKSRNLLNGRRCEKTLILDGVERSVQAEAIPPLSLLFLPSSLAHQLLRIRVRQMEVEAGEERERETGEK